MLPTNVPGAQPGQPREYPTSIQVSWDEGTVAAVHGVAAGLFILMLLAICFFFAWEARRLERRIIRTLKCGAPAELDEEARLDWQTTLLGEATSLRWHKRLHYTFAVLMIVGGLVIGAGWLIDGFDDWLARTLSGYRPLFLGEALCVVAFSLSWLVSAHQAKKAAFGEPDRHRNDRGRPQREPEQLAQPGAVNVPPISAADTDAAGEAEASRKVT